MNYSFILFTSFFLYGCSTYLEREIYKPAPATYQEWSKSGASILEIKKSLLECGKPAPDISFEIYEKAFGISRYDELAYMNKLQLENICMQYQGYKFNGIYKPSKVCSLEKYKTLPACQPDAEIPTPSVERRLSSWYCKVKSDYEYCLEHALAPKLCSREKMVNPSPECLPPGQEYKSSSVNNQPERKKGTQAYEPMREYPEKSLRLQQEMQMDSNRQMDKLLRDTAPKTHR